MYEVNNDFKDVRVIVLNIKVHLIHVYFNEVIKIVNVEDVREVEKDL